MAKQIKAEQWLILFEKYKTRKSDKDFWLFFAYKSNKKITSSSKSWFKYKFREYNLGNMKIIYSKSGKAPKKGKGVGRPKKKKVIDWDEFTREDMVKIIEWYIERDEKEERQKQNIKDSQKLSISSRKKVKIFGFSRSGYFKHKNKMQREQKVNYLDSIIKEAYYHNKGIFGRQRLAIFFEKKHNIVVNYRTLGRKMQKLGLKSIIRKAKKQRENKNTNVKFENLMQRNYNDTNNLNIVSTDVSYIPATYDSYNNHLYLSIAIHNKTKKIIALNFGKSNDNNLVLETIYKLPKFSNWIIHSDHGVQYSSYEYRDLIKELNGQISMSRVGNSLDNREAEYFFSNIKSECLNFLNYSKLNFEELKTIIADYINWYNNERFQSAIKWKTPQESWGVQQMMLQ